jgi:glycosyltransferase involved in cell wall biosynthesis
MLVSVIVPVYNVEKYLARCLDSLVAQDFSDYEILCVNDCSPDSSGDILHEYAMRFPGLIRELKNENNLGLGKTRERALEFARGEYVLFVDSDDYVKPDYISSYIQAAMLGEFDIVAGGFIRDVNGKLKEHRLSDSVWSSTTYAIACAKLIRISFIKRNNLRFTAVSCGEDIYFSLSAFYCNARVKIIDYAGYYYVLNPSSITGSMDYTKNHERIMAELFRAFLDRYDLGAISQVKRDVIEYVYLANMVNALVVFNHGCGVKLMRSKAEFVFNDAAEKFPNYLSNPHIGIFKPKGQTLKIRLGVGVLLGLKRINLEKPLLYLISLC